MKKMDLMKAMNGIDEQFLLEADPYEKAVRRSFSLNRSWRMVSAFAVLLLAVGIFFPFYQRKGAPTYNNFAGDSAPITEYASQEDKATAGFELLPQTLAGGTLSESYVEEDLSVVAVYRDSEGKEICRVIRQNTSFEAAAAQLEDETSQSAAESETDTMQYAREKRIETVYWENNGFYYCLEIRVTGDTDSGELIAEAIGSIR